MARRRGRGLTPHLILVLAAVGLSACAARVVETEPSSTTATSVTAVPSTTAMSAATTTTTAAALVDTPQSEVLIPAGPGPHPGAVLLHGGGWVAGRPELMSELAGYLAEEGYLVVNAGYTLAGDRPGFPQAVHDAACAVRRAAGHPDGDGTVTVIGHSAGAHIGALVALDDGEYGDGCEVDSPAAVGRLVGLAGPYQVSRLGPLLLPFFGVSPAEDPELWAAGDPFTHVDGNPALEVLLLYGEDDRLVEPRFALDFAEALTASGKSVTVQQIDDARHSDMHHPDFVGQAIVEWLGAGT